METQTTKKVKSNVRAKIITWSQMMEVPEEPEWIIKNLFAVSSVITMFGSGGSKKTYVALDLSMNIQIKPEWLGFPIPKSVPILWIDEESGRNRLSHRYIEAKNGYKVKNELPIYTICMARFSLRDGKEKEYVKGVILATKAKLVIIDSLVTVLNGDENSSKDIAQLYTNLKSLAEETQCAILIIHHSNKLEGYRGSSAIRDQSDLLIQVTSKNTSPNIDFKTDKERDIAHTEWSAVSFLEKNKKFYLSSSVKKLTKLGSVQEYILRYANDYTRMSIKDLENNCNGHISKVSIRGTVYKLMDMGYLEQAGKEGKLAMFSLSSEGSNYCDAYISTPIDSYIKHNVSK